MKAFFLGMFGAVIGGLAVAATLHLCPDFAHKHTMTCKCCCECVDCKCVDCKCCKCCKCDSKCDGGKCDVKKCDGGKCCK